MPSSQALKPTWLSGYILAGPNLGEDRSVPMSCPSRTVRLIASVGAT